MKTVDLGSPSQVDESASLDAPTRQRVLSFILVNGSASAATLAAEFKLTPAAIRRHLGALTAAGLLVSKEKRIFGRRGRGRPTSVFVLTDNGRAAFHHAYDELAAQAFGRLLEALGPAGLVELAEERVSPVVTNYQQLRDASADLSPLEALTVALSEDGYAASISSVDSGTQLCQHHCPVANVAQKYPVLCEVETQVFARLLDSRVQRLATIAHGDGVCTTHISRPIAVPKKEHK